MPTSHQSVPPAHTLRSGASEMCLSPSLSFPLTHGATPMPNWKPRDPQKGGTGAEEAPTFRKGELGTGGQEQPKKAGMEVGRRAHLRTPLPVFQFPRQGADPPPTSRGASAWVPVPEGRPARSLQPRAITTFRPNPVSLRSRHCPVSKALTSPRCPYLAPEYPAGGRARRHLSR